MNPETRELVRTLGTVHQHLPSVISGLLADDLPIAREREFAARLVDLGELLHHHADGRTPATGRHALHEAANATNLDPDEPPRPL